MSQILCAVGKIPAVFDDLDFSWNKYLNIYNGKLFNKPQTYRTDNIFCFGTKVKGTQGNNVYHTNKYIFVWDGDIYNREDLYTLSKDFSKFDNIEIAANLYMKYGDNSFLKMQGDFVLCVIDKETKNITCNRSPLGMRSLYYYYDDSLFLCATSLELILTTVSPKIVIDSKHFTNYLMEYLHCPFRGHAQFTPYNNTYILKHSHTMDYFNNRLSVKLQWKPKVQHLHYRNEEDYYDHFRDIFKEATLNIINSQPQRPWALSLSGGLDSSSVTCMLFKLYQEGKINSMPILYHDHHPGEGDELEYAQAVADYVNKELIIKTPPDLYYDFNLDTSMDFILPTADIYIRTYEDSQIVPSFEIIMMSGIAGDQILTGESRYISKYIKQCRFISYLTHAKRMASNMNASFLSIIQTNGIKSAFSKNNVYNCKGLLDNILTEPYHKIYEEYLNTKPLEFPTIYNDPVAQRDYTELMTRDQWSKEDSTFENIRSPFLNLKLVEYCLSLPGELRFNGLQTKVILRKAMENYMPIKITNRTGKSGIDNILFTSLKRDWNSIENIYENSILEKSNIFKKNSIKNLFFKLKEGTIMEIVPVLRLLDLEMWLQIKKMNNVI